MADRTTLQSAVDGVLTGRATPPQSEASLRSRTLAREALADGATPSLFKSLSPGGGAGTLDTVDAAGAAEAAAPPEEPPFSVFSLDDLQQAVDLASHFMAVAESDGVEAAVGAIQAERGRHVPGLLEHATKLFITHTPEARKTLRIGPLERRQPQVVRSSRALANKAGSGQRPGSTPPEDKMDWAREDPLLNEHHEHWHLVYPAAGRPSARGPGGVQKLGDRHGELFGYMHEQMLARYDADRLSVGLERVQPFTGSDAGGVDYTQPIDVGYDPGGLMLWGDSGWVRFKPRPPGQKLTDLTVERFARRRGALLSSMAEFHRRLLTAAGTGSFEELEPPVPVTASGLGDTAEANIGSVEQSRDPEQNRRHYGNLHNDGHIHFAFYDNDADPRSTRVMATVSAAVRDPVFWRWHKAIDDIFFQWQQTQEPWPLELPDLVVRGGAAQEGAFSPDIILARWDDLPPVFDGAEVGTEAYGEKLGQALFGAPADAASHWDEDFSDASIELPPAAPGIPADVVHTTGELVTEMRKRVVEVFDERGLPVDEVVDFLALRDFYYFVRVQNLSPEPRFVTVRIFLAPEQCVEDRRAWIEMDRFSYELLAGERAVIARPSDLAAVVRKPALRPADLAAGDQPSPKRDQQPWCDCGWPYTRLLPRGTAQGMPFRLFVMCSDGDDLKTKPQEGRCSSMSYCGLQDQEYPDKYMGYPFSRPFRGTIADAVEAHDNMAWRTITIRCRNLPEEDPGDQ